MGPVNMFHVRYLCRKNGHLVEHLSKAIIAETNLKKRLGQFRSTFLYKQMHFVPFFLQDIDPIMFAQGLAKSNRFGSSMSCMVQPESRP